MTAVNTIAIIGGGICGLATAIACRAAGASVQVIERAPTLAPLGTAISLWPNAQSCLAEWGLAAQINAIGCQFDRISTRTPDGGPILDFDLGGLHKKFGFISRCVTRADLQRTLAAPLPAGTIRLNTTVRDVSDTEDGACVTLADNSEIGADLIVVADGQNSALRDQIVGPSPLRWAGYGAVLGLAQTWVNPPGWGDRNEACEYYGPNGRFGVFRVGGDQTYWFFVSSRVPKALDAKPTDIDWILNELRDWPAFTRDLVRATPKQNMPQVAFHDRAPARHWGKGRVILAGDAAHPMLPNFGQGANQAIEDAHAIGLAVRAEVSGSAFAAVYAKHRKARAERFVAQNRQSGRLLQLESPIGQSIRNIALKMTPERMLQRQFDWQFKVPKPHWAA